MFVDTSAVPAFSEEDTMVMPAPQPLVASIKAVFPKVSRADYGGTGESTGLVLGASGAPANWIRFTVKDEDDFKKKNQPAVVDRDFQLIRRTVVYAQSELLALAERPIEEALCTVAHDGARPANVGVAAGEPIELDGLYAGLEPGRFVIVSGERADVGATRGVFASEPVMITSVVHDVRAAGKSRGPWTYVAEAMRGVAVDEGDNAAGAPTQTPGRQEPHVHRIDKPFAYCYRRDTVTIYGNVVKATHGETRNEVLGSGDGAKPLQASR